jgi:hypothetical protein
MQRERGSSVSIATRLRAGQPKIHGSIPEEIFLFYITFGLTLRSTQPLIEWGLGAVSLKVKWQKREADHSPPSRTEVKNGGAIPPLPICLHGVMLN